MELQDIYLKTEKATMEIQHRRFNLPQKIRSLLIMIDGTKSVEVFNNFSEVLGDVRAMLAVLEEQGFIQKHQVVEKPNQATERALEKNTEKIPDEGQEKTQPIKDTVDTSLFNIS